MRDDGAKIGHRAYQEAEQGKSMSLEIISTIARWYHSTKLPIYKFIMKTLMQKQYLIMTLGMITAL